MAGVCTCTSMYALGHILVAKAEGVDWRSWQLLESIDQFLHSFVIILPIERVSEAKGSVMEAREERLVHSEVVFGLS